MQMQFIEKNNIQMKESLDYVGVPAFIMTLVFNLAKLLTDWNINFWLLLITSFGGVVYVIYKIVNAHKESVRTNLEIKNQELNIKKQELEIEKLKKS